MRIKRKVQKIVEALTGRRCVNCKHNKGFFCENPKVTKCVSSFFPVGWEKKEKGGASNE